MNKVLAWVKSNWLIVVLSVVAVVSLPTMLFFSSRMNKSLRDDVQKKVEQDYRDVSNVSLNYTLSSPIPGVEGIEHRAVPNAALIDWFSQRQQAIKEQAVQVWQQCLEFNKGSRTPLTQNLFPSPPANADVRYAMIEFARAVVAQSGDLLRRMRAGPPPDKERLVAELREAFDRRREQIAAQGGDRDLPKEQVEELIKDLTQIRVDRYRIRAGEIDVYADPAVFADIPARAPDAVRDVGFCWEEWQEPLWIITDVVDAIVAANAAARQAPGVPGSVVKRLIRIETGPITEPAAAPATDDFGRVRGSRAGQIELDPSVSVTGRVSGGRTSNQLYDVRPVKLEVIVSTQRLPELIEALAKVNLMTVIDMDIVRVDPVEELNQGYYYGDEHVVRATLEIETIWLREWTAPLMPPNVRNARGVEDPVNPAGPEGG